MHQRTKFYKDRSNRYGDIAIFVIFQDGRSAVRGQYASLTVPNFIKIGQTVAEIWRFNVFFQNGGRPPSWICWAPTVFVGRRAGAGRRF